MTDPTMRPPRIVGQSLPMPAIENDFPPCFPDLDGDFDLVHDAETPTPKRHGAKNGQLDRHGAPFAIATMATTERLIRNHRMYGRSDRLRKDSVAVGR